MRADFRHYYHAGLDEALSTWPIGECFDALKYLPPDAALWREIEAQKPNQDTGDDDTPTYKTKGEEVRAFFSEHFGQSSAG